MEDLQLSINKKDTLHFFVYNTHNLFLYNIRERTFKSFVVDIKIPANFMSIETQAGKCFITGGGEPGKANNTCYEFVDQNLVKRKNMLYERRAHTLTEIINQDFNSLIYAIGSSLPTESMDKCEVYDTVRDKWLMIPNLKTKRNFHSSIAFENRYIYVVAGFNGGQRTNLIEKFDTTPENRVRGWQIVNVKMNNQTNWICLEGCGLHVIRNNEILIFGGFKSSDQKSSDCFLFNTD